MQKNEDQLGLQAILFLLAAALIYQILQYSFHNLENKKNWHSVKTFNPIALMTPQELMTERQALSLDRLNVAAWNGFNELYWSFPLKNPESFEFDLTLDQGAYLEFYFSHDNQKMQGLRLSRHHVKKNKLLQVNYAGQYVHKEDLVLPDYIQKKIADREPVKVKITSSGLLVDHKKVFSSYEPLNISSPFSFRTGFNPVYVDHFLLKNKYEFQSEDFDPPFQIENVVIALFLLILLGCLVPLNWRNVVLINCIIFLLVFHLWDKYIYSEKYPNAFQERSIAFEVSRKEFLIGLKNYLNFFSTEKIEVTHYLPSLNGWKNLYSAFMLDPDIDNSFKAQFPSEQIFKYLNKYFIQLTQKDHSPFFMTDSDWFFENRDKQRILFIGTSQMWGGGAARRNQSFAALATLKLNALKPTVSINMAAPGLMVKNFTDWNEIVLSLYNPQKVVYSFGVNDAYNPNFLEQYEKLIAQALHSKAKVYLILEAQLYESTSEQLQQTHKKIVALAERLKISVIDLQSFLHTAEVQDQGQIWRDHVHLSPYGHQLAADFIVDFLKTH